MKITQSALNANHAHVEGWLAKLAERGFSREQVTDWMFAWVAEQTGQTVRQLVSRQHQDMADLVIVPDESATY
ncbi:MAG: hypothetical protein IPO08_22690 [Xanthomonadales bacterium]|nr:hypothetical protein [Xanthomonadales bacterium]